MFDTFVVQRRRLLAAALLMMSGVACAAPAAGLPEAVRIAAVARSASGGKAEFAGSSALVARQGWLAAELGKLGVRLEWLPATTNSVAVQVNEAFANKSIDFAQYGDLPSVIANASGLQTRLVVPGGGQSNTYLVVPYNSTARSIDDLKGKKIALHRGRPWEYPFSRLLAAHGLKSTDIKLLNLNPQAGAAALASGSADAFFTLNDAYLLEDKKIGRIIWASKTPPEDWKMRAELWGRAEFLSKYPQLAQLVATAYVKASQTISADGGQEEYIRSEVASGLPEHALRAELEGNRLPWRARWSPRLTPDVKAHYAGVAQYAKQAGLIAKPLDTSNLYAPQFVDRALSDLKLQQYWAP